VTRWCVGLSLLSMWTGFFSTWIGLFSMFFKHLNRSSSRVGVGLFCVWIGLFCVRIELFCAWIGLFCVSRHVSFESTCLIRRIWIDLWVGALVSSCACEFVHLNRDSFIRVETLFCVNWSLWRVNRSHFSMNTSLLCLITGLYWSDISFVGYDSSARTHKSVLTTVSMQWDYVPIKAPLTCRS